MPQIIKRGPNTWQVRIYLGKDGTGKKQFHTKTIHGLKREAQSYAEEYAQRIKSGYSGKNATLQEVWDAYISVKKQSISPNTLYLFATYWRKIWKPLAGMNVEDITPMFLQGFIEQNSQNKPSWFKQALTPLKACLNQAVKWNLIARNPCTSLLLPVITRRERNIFTPEEITSFLDLCKESKYGLFFRLVLCAGMRTGEALALCWDCVDFEAGSITIKRDLINKTNEIREGVKTKGSHRTIKIDSTTLKALKEAHEHAKNNLVFPGAYPGHPISRTPLTQEFARLLNTLGITKEMRLYDLRHSHASFLIHCGLPVRAVSDRLGHSNPYMTLKTYTHSLPEQEAAITNLFDKL